MEKIFNPSVVHVVLLMKQLKPMKQCSKLVQKEYKQVRHSNVAKMFHWKLCEKWELNKPEKWYIHKPEKVLESEDCKILWDSLYRLTKPLNIIDQI